MMSGSTRLPASNRASSATVRSRRFSAFQATSRACWTRISGSSSRALAVSRAPSASISTAPALLDRCYLGDLHALLVLDRLHQILVAQPEGLVDLGLYLL